MRPPTSNALKKIIFYELVKTTPPQMWNFPTFRQFLTFDSSPRYIWIRVLSFYLIDACWHWIWSQQAAGPLLDNNVHLITRANISHMIFLPFVSDWLLFVGTGNWIKTYSGSFLPRFPDLTQFGELLLLYWLRGGVQHFSKTLSNTENHPPHPV